MGAQDVGTGALDLLVEGGLFYALPLFGISLLLVVEGRKRIPLTIGLVGFVLGFGLVGELYPLLSDSLPVGEQGFRLLAAVLIAGISVSVAEMAMRFLAAGLVYIVITNLIASGQRFDIDLEGDAFLSGVLTLIAFFLSFGFRRLIPALMAGLVGTLGMMLSVYIMLGWPVERLNGVDAPDAYLAFIGMLVSAYLQWKHLQRKRERDEEPEVEKEYIF
ncbi:MAG: hypothetical protein ISP84_02855 [Candidatus Poseidonia sp.]|jgi:hypothetical protein|nr:hypothetical protein [Poseidonia sp.]